MDSIDNFTPIGLLSIVFKILNKILTKKFSPWLRWALINLDQSITLQCADYRYLEEFLKVASFRTNFSDFGGEIVNNFC